MALCPDDLLLLAPGLADMDLDYVSTRRPLDYTFNFWTDYLGLSTLVSKSQTSNSITESLKATLGLRDLPPCACACGMAGAPDCGCAPGARPPQERVPVLGPFNELPARPAQHGCLAERRTRRTSAKAGKPELNVCVFCRNNGAPEEVYGSHVLKTPDGRVVTCPVLRAYTCPLCRANGDAAHTIKYCPLSPPHRGVRRTTF
ncbi:nanos homolog 1-like [Nerophis ophidion]|uniref:nanos homolog 1-like n=1 Tax=Nerophis ophidion TaxID=159077 RepID=UPI002ADF4222|nr:nanos homolog 1-like [Nerophis ophidion]